MGRICQGVTPTGGLRRGTRGGRLGRAIGCRSGWRGPDFEANQDDILPKLRRWSTPQYVSLVARLLPRVDEGGRRSLRLLCGAIYGAAAS